MTDNQITAEAVRDVLFYNPFTGAFVWKPRRADHFLMRTSGDRQRAAKRWNNLFAGRVAGHYDKDGYRKIGIFRGHYFAHRLAWLISYGMWPRRYIDHINTDRADNRLCNLRECSMAENMQNLSPSRPGGKVGLLGVTQLRHSGRFQAAIKANGASYYLGLFDTKEEAHAAYLRAKQKLHCFSPSINSEGAAP